MMSEHPYTDHGRIAIEAIDEALATPPPTIEEALTNAVTKHWMTEAEAEECLAAYERKFGGNS